jgi:hypothetical protein
LVDRIAAAGKTTHSVAYGADGAVWK